MVKVNQNSVIMQKVIVFDRETRIGYGYVFLRNDGRTLGPDLYYDSGEKLPQGWYNLVVTDDAQLVVMPKKVQ